MLKNKTAKHVFFVNKMWPDFNSKDFNSKWGAHDHVVFNKALKKGIISAPIILGRDPLGVRPLYIGEDENGICFSSVKRGFIFLDEWLSYYLLYNLWYNSDYYMFSLALILSILFNGYGYKYYWEIEEKFNDYLIKRLDK